MKLTTKIISTLALSSLIVFTGVQAHERHNPEKKLEKLTKHLSLSDEQRQKIEKIFSSFEANFEKPSSKARKANKSEMKAKWLSLMNNPTFDEVAVTEQINQRTNKRQARAVNFLKMQHAIYQELTPEQQPKFLKMVEKKMKKRFKNRS